MVHLDIKIEKGMFEKNEPAHFNTKRRYQLYGCVHCLDCVHIRLLAVFIFCIYVNKLFILIFIFLYLKHIATEIYAPCIYFVYIFKYYLPCVYFLYVLFISNAVLIMLCSKFVDKLFCIYVLKWKKKNEKKN